MDGFESVVWGERLAITSASVDIGRICRLMRYRPALIDEFSFLKDSVYGG